MTISMPPPQKEEKSKKKQVDPGLAPSVTSALIRYCVIWSRSRPDPNLSLRCVVSFPVTAEQLKTHVRFSSSALDVHIKSSAPRLWQVGAARGIAQ